MINRIISTIGKHIVAGNALTSRNKAVGIDKPIPSRIIVAAIEVIQPRLGIVDIAPVTQGIHSSQGGGKCPAHAPCFAPRAVGIGNHLCPRAVYQPGHIALRIPEVEIVRPVVVHGHGTDSVVGDGVPPANPAFCVLKAGLAAYSSPRVEISCPSTSRKELFDLLQ